MKDSRTILKESGITVKDMMQKDAEEKIVEYGWKCQVEIIKELAFDEQERFELMEKIKIKRDIPD